MQYLQTRKSGLAHESESATLCNIVNVTVLLVIKHLKAKSISTCKK